MKLEKTKSADITSFWDWVGMVLSGACLVHCMVLPFLVALLPILGLQIFLHQNVHKILATILIFSSALAFVPGYLAHKNRVVLYWLVPSLGIIIFTAFFINHWMIYKFGMTLNVIGGMCLIKAHYLNRTFCRDCSDCHHEEG